MFKQIVSQLSLSPSAASQLVFYARRLQQESITRTFSAIAAVLIVGLQFSVIAAPPAPANAASPGDIIYGGFVSKDDALNRYDESAELQKLYNYFGISRADVVHSHITNINSLDHSLNSLGRVQHASTDKEVKVGTHTYWARYLYQFDTGYFVKVGSTYKVLEGYTSRDHSYFAIMYHCGNIVFKKFPPKPTPPPPPKPSPTPTPPPPPKTSLACIRLSGDTLSGTAPLTVKFTGLGAATGDTIDDYIFDLGDSSLVHKSTGSVVHVYQNPGKFIAHLQIHGKSGKTTAQSEACSYTVNVTAPPAAFNKTKSALNLTQNIDATTKNANSSDQIRYTLTTKNTGGIAENYVVTEHITDVLEYADVTDSGGASVSDGVMIWPSVKINPGQTIIKSFVVKIKNPIPDTPVGVSDHFSYDLRLDNIYGNSVHISVTPPVAKQVEAASTYLPATGAPVGTLIVLIVSALSLFFYFRNRQLLTEIKLLRGEYQGGAL
jgi:hypothetical protein